MPNIKALKIIFEKNPPERHGLNKEKLLYIISFVFNHQMKYFNGDDDYAVTICTNMFQDTLGRNYKEHFEYLVQKGILELDSNHFTGITCRKYVLTDGFLCEPSFYPINGFTFGRALKRRKPTKNGNKYHYLDNWLNKVDFDVEAATVFNNLMYESRKIHLPFQTISKRNRKRPSNPLSQYTHGQLSILRMQMKDKTGLLDDKGMRFHTAITNCPKLLRNYITIGGQHLVSIDIKNSQPYMLLALLEPNNFKKMRNTTHNYLPIPTTLLSTRNIPSIILRHSSEIISSIEFQEYKKMVTNGTIYDEFEDLVTIGPGEIEAGFSARDIVKFRFMLCFYSPNGCNSNGMKSAFRLKFPKIYSLICHLKEEDHRALSILLQRVESILVLDKICGRIAIENPSIPILTIHDSILTTPNYVDYVVKIIEEESSKYIGVAPKLSLEYCSPQLNNQLLIEMDSKAKEHFKRIENEQSK